MSNVASYGLMLCLFVKHRPAEEPDSPEQTKLTASTVVKHKITVSSI